MIGRELGWVFAAVVLVACDDAGARPPGVAPATLPPVLCAEYPADRQDVVSCRYVSQAQTGEVWVRSTQLAATSAVSLGASHIQWLSVDTRVDTMPVKSEVECTRTWGWSIKCNGGPTEMPVGFIAVSRFALLSPAEAAARLSDPLVPADRRPMDARTIAAAAAARR